MSTFLCKHLHFFSKRALFVFVFAFASVCVFDANFLFWSMPQWTSGLEIEPETKWSGTEEMMGKERLLYIHTIRCKNTNNTKTTIESIHANTGTVRLSHWDWVYLTETQPGSFFWGGLKSCKASAGLLHFKLTTCPLSFLALDAELQWHL